MHHVTRISTTVSMAIIWCHVATGSWKLDATNVRVSISNVSTGQSLEVTQMSSVAGYIQTPGFGYNNMYPQNMNSMVRVEVPTNYTVMVTMLHLSLPRKTYICDVSKVTLVVCEVNLTNIIWQCGNTRPVTRQYLSRGSDLYLHFKSGKFQQPGFKLFFSVSEESALLLEESDDTWNCSVKNFAELKPHFPCDLQPQCLNKEDERDCPYFSEECGLGFITLGNRCLFYEKAMAMATWRDMELKCVKRGGHIATLRTQVDHDRVLHYLEYLIGIWGFTRIIVGLYSAPSSMPMMYRREVQHMDKTIAFYRRTYIKNRVENVCGYIFYPLNGDLKDIRYIALGYCAKLYENLNVLCQRKKISATETILPVKIQAQPVSNFNNSHLPLFGCPLGHLTRDFLVCDVAVSCWSRGLDLCTAPQVPLPPSFSCANGYSSVPYTMVCDFRPDCSDSSDESFCEFPPCDLPEPFYCSDSECVPQSVVCNFQKNCYNSVDEELCSEIEGGRNDRPPPPGIFYVHQRGTFIVHKTDQLATCPKTHFQCPNNGYCMPVFLRCNGVYDCLGWEDEADCLSYTCPGFYRCRGSQVCLHPQNLCDGIFQCPQNDDELLCNLSCPEKCICYGLAFFCQQPIRGRDYIKLRYLDGRGSGIQASNLTENVMLIYLNVAANGLTTINELTFPNLRILDISNNQLKEILTHNLRGLPQLETLSLSGNPLLSLFQSLSYPQGADTMTNSTNSPKDSNLISQPAGMSFEETSTIQTSCHKFINVRYPPENRSENTGAGILGNVILPSLRTLDLSQVRLKVLDPIFLSLLPNVRTINMSGCGVDTLLGDGFQAVTQLRVLDLRGCPMTYFPRDVFKGLKKLTIIHSDTYKLCCPATLPIDFFTDCHAPSDMISSCEALLRSNSYRVFLSAFAILSLLGNASSFFFRVFMQNRKKLLSFDVFVAHLCVADFWMGVYLSMIGVADRLYLNTYMWEDNTWKASTVCNMAGFLSLVSSEVSALIICLITIDRFLVLRFPFSTAHFGPRSAQVASLCAWSVGYTLAIVPLIPEMAHWQFYSQTGICIPLPVSGTTFPGYSYAFGVMIVANSVFFIVIAAGQIFIYWSVHSSSLSSSETTRKSKDLTMARRLITVAMSDFLCWFPIGVAGMLAATGIPITGEVNVAMAIFVLPFNSALNPFLYTLNIVLEKRRKSNEQRTKERLMAQLGTLTTGNKHLAVSS